MLRIETAQFGTVCVDEDKILTMEYGMPGFPGNHRFVIVDREESRPFYWYQCVDNPGLSFVIIDPYVFKPDYRVDIDSAIRDMAWESDGRDNVMVYVVVNASYGQPEKITANLMAPLLINLKRKTAAQIAFPNSPYSHKYRIFAAGESGDSRKPSNG